MPPSREAFDEAPILATVDGPSATQRPLAATTMTPPEPTRSVPGAPRLTEDVSRFGDVRPGIGQRGRESEQQESGGAEDRIEGHHLRHGHQCPDRRPGDGG